MENQTRAINWILTNSATLSLTIESTSWIRDIFPMASDVHCTMTVDGRRIDSWGWENSEDLALCKAFSEGLERIVFLQSGQKTSNGFASHIHQEAAHKNAKMEVVERDLFLCHYLTGTPMHSFLPPEEWLWIDAVNSWSNERKIETTFFNIANICMVCVITGHKSQTPFGMTIGSSANENIEFAAQSSFVEAARQATVFISRANPDDALSIQSFQSLEKPNFTDHGRLALHIEYWKSVTHLFDGLPSVKPMQCQPLDKNSLSSERIDLNLLNLSNCPFVFARAFSNHAQNLWTGPTTAKVVNLERLRRFAGRPLTWNDLNHLPHPFN
ncbi:MAG: YcaO-like family protein [Bdellovibrionales bacterium]|nr:YcaO-like family protein [Bdellovibrionales bacterium]